MEKDKERLKIMCFFSMVFGVASVMTIINPSWVNLSLTVIGFLGTGLFLQFLLQEIHQDRRVLLSKKCTNPEKPIYYNASLSSPLTQTLVNLLFSRALVGMLSSYFISGSLKHLEHFEGPEYSVYLSGIGFFFVGIASIFFEFKFYSVLKDENNKPESFECHPS